MCGIVGIVDLANTAPIDPGQLRRMCDVLAHRGPDGSGFVESGPAGLGHRRLAIVDVAGGAQPIANEDGSAWVVCNGEIYNHAELRARLQHRGHRYRTASDTETIVHLYEDTGERCVDELHGMFAFAVWDAPRRRLLLARDRLGIKPLYYAIKDGRLYFASEIKAILAAGAVRPEFERDVLPEYLASRFVAGEQTFFRGIRKLLPGKILTWTPTEGLRVSRYWRPPLPATTAAESPAVRARQLRERLEASVRSHLMSDVPLGLFLSGGVDSSALLGLMSRAMREPVRTFAVGFDEPGASELAYARLAASSAGALHRELVVTRDEFLDAMAALVWHEDEPVAFTSAVPLFLLSKLAARKVKVVLTGEGSDELFLGYSKYRLAAWNERLDRVFWSHVPAAVRALARRALSHAPSRVARYAKRSVLGSPPGLRSRLFDAFAVFPEALQRELLADRQALERRDPYAEALGVAAYVDLQTYLVELLMKQDRMSMAASIETRVPFLDHRLVEYAASIPVDDKLRGLSTKAVLRDAVGDLVPKEILARSKMGFPVPFGRWLRGGRRDVVDEYVLSPRALRRGLFDTQALRTIVEEHRLGAADHGERLWLLVNLELWQRIFLEGEDARLPRRQAA
jgi:asparagine synthase (glutamine-hydrolysing)